MTRRTTDLRLSPAAAVPLAEELVAKIVAAIVAGDFAADTRLPPETQLAEAAGVSRLTIREAIKSLIAKNMVRIERGRGTFVNPPSEWSPLDAQLLLAQIQVGSPESRKSYILSLIEARRCIEVGAAELCAARCTDADIAELHRELDEMEQHRDNGSRNRKASVKAFAIADLAFHRTILRGTRNAFLASLLLPIEQAVAVARELTSVDTEARKRAIEDHRRILSAVELRDPTAAASAMREHLDHTIEGITQLSSLLKPLD